MVDGVDNQLVVFDKGDFFGEMFIFEDMLWNVLVCVIEKI